MAEISLFLALVLVIAAGHKLLDRERLATSAAALTGAPQAMGATISLAAAAYEAATALCLIFPATRTVGTILAALVWLAYGAALWRRLGSTLDCGCNFAARAKPVDRFSVARALGLAALAATTLLTPAMPLTILSPFAALGFLALYLALGEIMSITTFKRGGIA
jgi:hypothetical protein